MLVLSRKAGEAITIGDRVKVHVVEVREGYVRLGIEAPRDVEILRDNAVLRVPKANVEGGEHD